MPKKTPHLGGTKADALLCPSCCIEYMAVQFDLEVNGTILRDVEALRCPSCGDELFTPEQLETIRKRSSQTMNP